MPDAISRIFSHSAGEPDPRKRLTASEDDAPLAVVPGILLVLPQDGELDAVDRTEFVKGKPEFHRGEDVDFDKGLAAFVIGTEWRGPLPIRRKAVETIVAETRIPLGPSFINKPDVETVTPKS